MLALEYRRAERCHPANNEEILGLLENDVLSDDEWRDLHKVDAVVTALRAPHRTGPRLWLCVAVAAILTAGDVRRAARAAEAMRRGFDGVVAVVGGDYITADAATLALDLGVHVLRADPVTLVTMS